MAFETPGRLEDDVRVQSAFGGGFPQEQLPRQTSKQLLYRVYSGLLSAYITALSVQLISYVPSVKPNANRIPFIAVGAVVFTIGILKHRNKPVPSSAFTGVIIGSVMGL